VSVLIEVEQDSSPQRRFFVVAQADRARAEWSAIDCAMIEGSIAASPANGLEPVEAIRAVSAAAMRSAGLTPGATRALGPRLPRKWLAAS
jgi:hypothetical protein